MNNSKTNSFKECIIILMEYGLILHMYDAKDNSLLDNKELTAYVYVFKTMELREQFITDKFETLKTMKTALAIINTTNNNGNINIKIECACEGDKCLLRGMTPKLKRVNK